MTKFSRGGRPKQKVTKSKIIALRLTYSEYIILKALSEKSQLLLSEFIRNRALSYKLPTKPSDNKVYAIRQLAGLSNNINQIAKKLNSEERHRGIIDDLKMATKEMTNIIRHMK